MTSDLPAPPTSGETNSLVNSSPAPAWVPMKGTETTTMIADEILGGFALASTRLRACCRTGSAPTSGDRKTASSPWPSPRWA